MKAVVFLGGGNITGALAAGLRLAGYAGSIVVYDRHAEKVRALRRESGVVAALDLKLAIESAGIAGMVVVAVRPGSVREMLAEVVACGALSRKARLPRLWVSLAAGIPLRNLRSWLPVRWGRAMPSPVCRIGRGLTPVCFDASVSSSEQVRVRKFLSKWGQCWICRSGEWMRLPRRTRPRTGIMRWRLWLQRRKARGWIERRR